jgi:hypothetical protein
VIADEIHEQLCAADHRHAMVDFDHLGSAWPRKVDVALRNLRSVWTNYADEGIDRLVIATMLRSREQLEGIRHSIPSSVIMVCLLRADAATLDARLRARQVGSDLEGHLRDAAHFASFLDRAGLEDFAIENEGRTVPEVASEILDRIGWLRHRTPSA